MRFRPEQHLRRPGDFRTLREQGRRIDCGAFTLWWRVREPAAATPTRVGFVASSAQVGGAVARARAKRRLRETFRLHQALVPPGLDLMLVARTAVNRWAFPELGEKFSAACQKLSAAAHV
jgi:ribonuclease P protein component